MKLPAHAASRFLFPASASLLTLCLFLSITACSPGKHTWDAHLRKIDEMLEAKLPAGTSKAKVVVYLNSQGFPLENTTDPHTVVSIVRHIDPNTLQPATARVTFHFDGSDRLKTYDLATAEASSSKP
jgi:hypothetical protein